MLVVEVIYHGRHCSVCGCDACSVKDDGVLHARWRRDVTAGARLHQPSYSTQTSHVSSTHATTRPPTTTTTSVTVTESPSPRLTDQRPLAVQLLGRRPSSDIRRNPLKDVGQFVTITIRSSLSRYRLHHGPECVMPA